MKKIGFIDYYIDQWHANNYPRMIRESRIAGSAFEVSMAWAKVDPPGKTPLAAWCRQHEVEQASSIQQVVEQCDAIVVMSPDHAGMHEELGELALASGKPVYIDKPIAPTRDAASRLFERAARFGTPLMSCSALRFAPALVEFNTSDTDTRSAALIRGGGTYDVYAIHQVEMLVMLLGCGATRVQRTSQGDVDTLAIGYDDARFGTISLLAGHPFEFSVRSGQRTVCSGPLADFFPRFIDAMLSFFQTGHSSVKPAETLEIAGIVEAGKTAVSDPLQWVPVALDS